MNNNTKSRFKSTTRKSRSLQAKSRNPRNSWNKQGKVAATAKRF